MAETEKPQGVSVAPPTVPIPGVNVPDPTTGDEQESKDPSKDPKNTPNDTGTGTG